ncbi:hypothetical protein L1S35_00410 [Flavobacterium sp. AS60]|uniref:beta strand repeat-containing protein n=1 Tax=Flavobacterium anseongense TaxID=2910677 RepID=UPI001F2D7516|nr:hypothetical protein [Flavobacterium sp. AS60]MCF6128120.1 hypothetical protein [Flavobacterium sp. AS60]
MKLKIYIYIFLLLIINASYAQVGIGTTSPNASSMLDITSTNSGLLIPRVALVSASDVTTITTPATSLLVYNSGFAPNGYYYWNGSLWVQLAVGSNTDWSLTGNTGTSSSTNFLGTTDDVDIVFKRFNVRAAFIGNPNTTSGNMNTSFGANSLLNPSGTRNVAVGTNVLPSNSTGNRNTSVGERSMFTNTTGSFNTAFGAGTLFSNQSGDFNTAIGRQSLTSNAFGLYNTALGNDSGYSLTNGSNNIFIGYRAGYNETGSNKLYIEYANLTTDSSQNNAIIYGDYGVSPKVLRANAQLQVGNPSVSGYSFPTTRGTAGQVLQTDGAGATSWASASSNDWGILGNSGLSGTTNFLGTTDAVDVAFRRSNAAAGKIGATSTSFGVGALNSGVATNSTAFGNNALSVSTGNNNVAIGQNALQNSASTAQWNTAVGTNALRGINNAAAQDNVAIGFEAMGLGTGNISNTTAVGSKAMQNSTGANNTAVGNFALAGAAGTQTGTENTAIGISSMRENVSGASNTGVGSGSLQFNQSTSNNVGIGFRALRSGGGNSVAVGNNALLSNTGANNTALGHQALGAITNGTGNVAIGNLAGSSETGASSNKLYIENSNADASNALIYGEFDNNIVRVNGTLQISNPASAPGYALPNVRGTNGQILQTNGAGTTSWVDGTTLSITETDPQVSSATSNVVPKWNGTTLVDGVMIDNGTNVGVGITPSVGNKLEVNGKTKTTNFQMTTGATANYILQSDATGNASWVNPTTLTITETDPQVSSATSNVVPKWDGTTLVDGVMTDDGTNVGVGVTPSVGNKLEVNGKTKTTDFQMTTGATANYVLQSDASGNASWALPNNTLSVVRTNLSGAQSLGTGGWQLVNFNTIVFDSNTEFNTGTNRFVAAKTGYYEVNAGFHTDNQSNTQFYSIGVYKNGSLYQQNSGNHSNLGPVSRTINCIVSLGAGDYIEIYAENYQSGVNIDSYIGKTFFEVKQIR